MLKDQNDKVRVASAGALGRIKPTPAGAVAGLALALKDKVRDVRGNAAWALARIELKGKEAETIVPALIDLLRGENKGSRSIAALALGRIGPAAHQAVPALVREMKREAFDRNFAVAMGIAFNWGPSATGALGRIGVAAVPALTEALKDKSARTRARAAFALGVVGQPAAAAVPALIQATEDKDKTVRDTAVRSLKLIRKEKPAKTGP